MTLDLERICTVQHERVVSLANTVQLGRRTLQIGPSCVRCHFVKCRVTVHETSTRTLTITYGPQLLSRHTEEGHRVPTEVRGLMETTGPVDGQNPVQRPFAALRKPPGAQIPTGPYMNKQAGHLT